jgi:hypothetical protein
MSQGAVCFDRMAKEDDNPGTLRLHHRRGPRGPSAALSPIGGFRPGILRAEELAGAQKVSQEAAVLKEGVIVRHLDAP